VRRSPSGPERRIRSAVAFTIAQSQRPGPNASQQNPAVGSPAHGNLISFREPGETYQPARATLRAA
jgi:hypothetical protein